MKRSRKLGINSCIIVVILFVFYYFGGFYFSKDQCVKETVRSLYGNESDVVMEFKERNFSMTLLTNAAEKTYSIVGTKKLGVLYRTASSLVGQKINEKEQIDISGFYNREMGMVIFVYRNDDTIEKVEVTLDNGEVFHLDEWKGNYAGFFLADADEWQSGSYRAYDAAGKWVCTKRY